MAILKRPSPVKGNRNQFTMTTETKRKNMSIKILFKTICFSFLLMACASNDDVIIPESLGYPSFGSAVEVTINDLSFDAMEPFISSDGNFLFFNNINDGINTKLYYATKSNDSTFDFIGELMGANQATAPHLDAVADMDVDGNFYWTSTRDYPAQLNNLFHGTFSAGNVSDIKRVEGDFNMKTPGWLVMDHGISMDGQFLYFNNARFDEENCQGPCETNLGIAQKNSDGTFSTIADSESILQHINNANYIYYAPCISGDNLELYFTRYLKGEITPSTVFEICVAVRDNANAEFSMPKVLFSEDIANLIEAPTLTADQNILYYHRKTADSHKIMMRRRTSL